MRSYRGVACDAGGRRIKASCVVRLAQVCRVISRCFAVCLLTQHFTRVPALAAPSSRRENYPRSCRQMIDRRATSAPGAACSLRVGGNALTCSALRSHSRADSGEESVQGEEECWVYKQDDARAKQVPVRYVHSTACLACGAGDDTARRQPCPCSSSLRATFGRTLEAKVLTMQSKCSVSVEAAACRCDLLQRCAVTDVERGLLGMHGVAFETLRGNSSTMRFARAAAADAAAAAARCATYDSACKSCVAMELMRVQACYESDAIARACLRLTILLRVLWRQRWMLNQRGSFARQTQPCAIRCEQGHRLAWVEFQNNKPHS